VAGKLYINSSHLVVLDGLKNPVTGSFYNNLSTVTYTLTDQKGNVLVPPTTMDYTTGSNGSYTASLPGNLSIVNKAVYIITVNVSLPTGEIAEIKTKVQGAEHLV